MASEIVFEDINEALVHAYGKAVSQIERLERMINQVQPVSDQPVQPVSAQHPWDVDVDCTPENPIGLSARHMIELLKAEKLEIWERLQKATNHGMRESAPTVSVKPNQQVTDLQEKNTKLEVLNRAQSEQIERQKDTIQELKAYHREQEQRIATLNQRLRNFIALAK